MKHLLVSIKARLIAGFVLMFALLSGLGAFGYYGVSTLGTHVEDLFKSNTSPIIDLAAVRAGTLRIRLNFWRAQVEQNKDATRRLADDTAATRAIINKYWSHYYPAGISSPHERALADGIAEKLSKFTEDADRVLGYIQAEDYEMARQYQSQHLAPSADALSKLLDDDMQDNITQATASADGSVSLAARIQWISVSLVMAGALVSLLVSTWLVRAVTRPLSRAVEIADQVSEGKLGEPIRVDSHDEFGKLIGALKRMDEKLTSTVRGIRESSESVMVASGQIASGNIDLSARTEEQAASLEQTAASMAEITETVKQNADNARQASSLARNASDLSNTNNQAVDEMVRTMGSITESSAKIADITSMIEGIAFQTNILALNAAVEAARAGEQGRGFAVVAGEVRSLAQRSSAAAKEIKDLIGHSSSIVQEGSRQASEVGTAMQEVARVINMVTDIVGEITAASDEQSAGVEQVHQAISQIDAATQQNAALVEEATAAAQSLEEQAKRMKDEVMFFRLAGDTTASALRRPESALARKPVALAKTIQAKRTQPARAAAALPASTRTPESTGTAVKLAQNNNAAWESF
ncbi:methyl-accepting chemotaxis protein [Cupriavidus numazuensis]|uniref:Methyl-accepting chemotaxis protein III n=1 Tax=Cupriavidus numazuensis TaxID=221992 RepID=A0ABN7QAJ4_9BURK|nr:methyl-accepting chemotaxis protein [Cupriavidus numazuensis]CAG2160499.1 Methyl-accepting chemotaxis protein III [Cupriavidus numazuensis]